MSESKIPGGSVVILLSFSQLLKSGAEASTRRQKGRANYKTLKGVIGFRSNVGATFIETTVDREDGNTEETRLILLYCDR